MIMKSIRNYIYSKMSNGVLNLSPALAKYRCNIIKELKNKDYSFMFFNNPLDVSVSNIIGMRQLMLEYMENDQQSLNVNLNKLKFSDSVLDYLVFKKANNLSIELLRRYGLTQMEYDFDFDEYNIYLNLNDMGPLLIRKMGTVNVYYRERLAGQLDDFLKRFFLDFSTDVIISEPLYIGLNKSLALKKFIVEKFSEVDLSGVDKNIIDDAYNDLIRVSSLDLSRDKQQIINGLVNYRPKYKNNLVNSINSGYYKVCPIEIEIIEYNNLMKDLNKVLIQVKSVVRKERGVDDLGFNIKPYYFKDETGKNRLKQDIAWIRKEVIKICVYNREISSIINDIHDDIVSSIFIFMFHIRLLGLDTLYYRNSVIWEYIRNITDESLRRKPILLKYAIKNGIDHKLHILKEKGMINLHQLENFFGYRVTDLIIDEVKEDYLAWFNEGLEKYGKVQSDFIHKWAHDFFESYNYKSKRLKDILLSNIRSYKDEDEILGNYLSYMHSKGAVDDEKVKTTKGKNRSISKNNYFNLVTSQQDYKIRGNRRNKVIIKREEYIKQRIVINSSLDTFVPLSKINKVLGVLFGGTGIIYYANNKDQKAEHYNRLNSYLSYNKYNDKRWLCMPLDYSSYDHTITLDMIESILIEVSNEFKLPMLTKWFKEFRDILLNEKIYFKELEGDPENNKSYKYGVLSGWKITSSIESIGNAIVTYGVFRELGEQLVDYETMGDDLIIILDKKDQTREQQLALLEVVCDFYQRLGFKMNVPKNSVGYYFLEFLRVTFRPGVIQGYPSRILGALFYVKPGKARLNFGASELLGVVNKVCKRYGTLSQKLKIAEYVTKAFLKDDVRRYFKDYVEKPWDYEIVRKRKVDFIYDVDIEQTPVYKRYVDLFGERYKKIILKVIEENIVEQARIITRLTKLRKKTSYFLDKRKTELMLDIVKKSKMRKVDDHKLLVLPEYHHMEILNRIMRRSHFGTFLDAVGYIKGIFYKMYQYGLMRYTNMNRNCAIIDECEDFVDVRTLLKEDKIGVDEYNIPAIVLSRFKLNLRATIRREIQNYTGEEKSFLKSVISKNQPILRRFLGVISSIKSELLDINSGLVVACMAD